MTKEIPMTKSEERIGSVKNGSGFRFGHWAFFRHSSFVIRHFSFSVPSVVLFTFTICAQPFRLPTANHALFEKNGEEQFFVGTVGKPWNTGTFGCVRSEGAQMHEG